MFVSVLVGPGVVADRDLLRELASAEFDALGVRGAVEDAPDLRAALARTRGPVVALPGDDRSVIELPGEHVERTVWLDLSAWSGPPTRDEHYQGREVWGLAWAVRRAVHRLRHPARRLAYGAGPEQWGELRQPPADGPFPVAVLVHGGFWRSRWNADLMDEMAIDLAARGFVAWNLEYRCPDRHGWAATTADIAAGLAYASRTFDRSRVVLFGHSAGGQLAVRAAADAPSSVALVVSLAGVLDLGEGARRGTGENAVVAALGGGPSEVPEVYAASDPLRRLPVGVPQLVVQGRNDGLDLVDMARRFARDAAAAGDAVSYLELPADHFDVISPRTPAWSTIMAAVDKIVTSE